MRTLLLMLIAMVIPCGAIAQEESGIGYPTVAAALEALKARGDVKISVQGGWTIVDDRAANAIWSFTPPNHPANPAVVKRALVSRDGAISVHMTALCQASKAPCDKLMEEFKELNARMSESIRSKAVSTPQQTTDSEIGVQRLGEDSYRLVLKSFRSRTVDAGQQELLPKAKDVCGVKNVEFGKYEFETKEPVSSTGKNEQALVLKQTITCGVAVSARPAAESAEIENAKWSPSSSQVERVELQSGTYFAAKDERRYQEAYLLLSAANQQTTSFERWSSMAEDFNSKAGSVLHRGIKKITWYKNPPQAAQGIYAAVDFTSEFTNFNTHCGYLVWHQQADGSLRLVREEQNYIDRATEQKLEPDQLASVRAKFKCKT